MRYHQHFVRCGHCGLAHGVGVQVCPTTGLIVSRRESTPTDPHHTTAKRRRLEPASRVGTTVADRYRVLSLIGDGGMSSVFEALDGHTRRTVALKVLHASALDDPRSLDELQHEARVVAAIGHPNICAVYELGTTGDGCPYLVMERLLGETLASRLVAVGSLDFWEIAPVLRDVLAALQAAHDKGVIHQDLKPHNVFLEHWQSARPSTCKLLDFGIATWMSTAVTARSEAPARSGWVVGTPYYMAPEQARGDGSLDQRVDLWSVAVIAYEALAGRRPFVASNYHALMVQILTTHPRPVQKIRPAIPDVVAALLDRGLAKAREDRFQTATEFVQAIARAERICSDDDMHRPTLIMRREESEHTTADQDEVTEVACASHLHTPLNHRTVAAVPVHDEEDTATTLVVRRSDRR